MNKKKITVFLTGMVAIAAVTGVWAYYSSSSTIDNGLTTVDAAGDNEVVEEFTPDEDWTPGEEVTKDVGVKNTGDTPLYVRIKLDESWMPKGETTATKELSSSDYTTAEDVNSKFVLPDASEGSQEDIEDGLIDNDESVVFKKLAASGWTYGNDGYWYYSTELAAGSTASFMESITLCADLDLGKTAMTHYYTTAATAPADDAIGTAPATQWVAYTGSVPSGATFNRIVNTPDEDATGYASMDYHLYITTEVLQAGTEDMRDAALALNWNDDVLPAVTP